MDALSNICSSRLIAVARTDDAAAAVSLVDALFCGGVRIIEFAFSHRSALASIERALEHIAKAGLPVTLGAGTVLDPETARSAILAGAQFVVSPSLNLDVIRMCRRYSVPVLPGALTPTEVVTAWEAGADLVKIFPASTFGPKYISELHGPLPQVKFVPTGGVNLDNAAEYLRAGATAVAVGGNLVSSKLVKDGDWAEIEKRARAFSGAVAAGGASIA
jgi:2-dehydro-3-deoxyphosphogluconate aldolase / (4S)-4-hydroxy-2-oxoglutarate aldolase